jgi:hypothetical protein
MWSKPNLEIFLSFEHILVCRLNLTENYLNSGDTGRFETSILVGIASQ